MDACDVCGALDLPQDEIVHLTRVGRDTIATPGEVNLCHKCLEARSERQWRFKGREGHRIERAFETHEPPPDTHFAYMVEDGAVLHLMRLDHQWIDAKAGSHVAPPNA